MKTSSGIGRYLLTAGLSLLGACSTNSTKEDEQSARMQHVSHVFEDSCVVDMRAGKGIWKDSPYSGVAYDFMHGVLRLDNYKRSNTIRLEDIPTQEGQRRTMEAFQHVSQLPHCQDGKPIFKEQAGLTPKP